MFVSYRISWNFGVENVTPLFFIRSILLSTIVVLLVVEIVPIFISDFPHCRGNFCSEPKSPRISLDKSWTENKLNQESLEVIVEPTTQGFLCVFVLVTIDFNASVSFLRGITRRRKVIIAMKSLAWFDSFTSTEKIPWKSTIIIHQLCAYCLLMHGTPTKTTFGVTL